MPHMLSGEAKPFLPKENVGVRDGDGSRRSRPGILWADSMGENGEKGEKGEKGEAASGVMGDDEAVEVAEAGVSEM